MIGLSFLTNYKNLLLDIDQPTLKKFADSFSVEEYESAKWMVNQLDVLKRNFSNVAILGSSFSTYLVPMICTKMKVSNIVLYDYSEAKTKSAQLLHANISDEVNVQVCTGSIEDLVLQIEQSDYTLVIVPYGDVVPALEKIRVKSNKAVYAIQATINSKVQNVMDLVVLSGCIQQKYRGVERVGNVEKAMVIGSKSIR